MTETAEVQFVLEALMGKYNPHWPPQGTQDNETD